LLQDIVDKDQQLREPKLQHESQRKEFLTMDQEFKEALAQIERLHKQIMTQNQLLRFVEQQLNTQKSENESKKHQLDGATENNDACSKLLKEARAKTDSQSQKLDTIVKELQMKDHQAHDARMAMDNLEIQQQDANESIKNLRFKSQQLQADNKGLSGDLETTRRNLSNVLQLAADLDKSRICTCRGAVIKRESSFTQAGRSPKRARQSDNETWKNGIIEISDDERQ
jgi:chromosome segregation ATPase